MKEIKRDRLTYEQKQKLKTAGLVTLSVIGTVGYIFAWRKYADMLANLEVEEGSN